ncbi:MULTISPECIES: hypothetical protein [Nitrobacteraceae]|jgi:FtsP/CotA-like multicopper oxidase with cupredoxin domain|uniref:Uncharacterized protein n=1 Tax=Rhodopseudomonas palustris TaxID=1076 RepID=A0A0D7EW67_RHOPL|nr:MULTISPECIES: hypothetical protein [Nitrobacteraceae]MBY0381002.1 hypothetical protein [Xanthobacteraceae bacterium]KIZ44780.1 hypothetical protein OO17_09245 [Rhodopseudomonas palustris]KQW18030.1 hypothetical protein ASC80_21535 [Afipia sp. Root123D2]MDF3811345.1 hypothetical protein [Rhodopseudomonas sp. BAL398]WOK20944.1 hypothetical protein RBJ75_28550 [Rhodopseudomonas sp. BAL398]
MINYPYHLHGHHFAVTRTAAGCWDRDDGCSYRAAFNIADNPGGWAFAYREPAVRFTPTVPIIPASR